MDSFTFEDIFRYFESKDSHKQSLKIAIRDILEKNIPLSGRMVRYLEDLLIELEKEFLYNQETEKSGLRQEPKDEGFPSQSGRFNNGNNHYEDYSKLPEQFPNSSSYRQEEHS